MATPGKLNVFCRLLAIMLCAACALPLQPVLASGMGPSKDTPIDQRGWQEFWDKASNARYPRHDENFIAGKQIFLGQRGDKRFRFCLAKEPDAERVPLTRKALRDYRRIPVTEFAKSLYDCDEPQAHVLQKMSPQDAGLVIYYLHKQYKLRLKQAPGHDGSKARAATRKK